MPQLNFYLKSESDLALIDAGAKVLGLKRTQFARIAVLNAARIAVEASPGGAKRFGALACVEAEEELDVAREAAATAAGAFTRVQTLTRRSRA